MQKTKAKIYDYILMVIPIFFYGLYFIYNLIGLSVRTSRPEYQEDYSGLFVIAVPVLFIFHTFLALIISLVLRGIYYAVKKDVNLIRTIWMGYATVFGIALFVWLVNLFF